MKLFWLLGLALLLVSSGRAEAQPPPPKQIPASRGLSSRSLQRLLAQPNLPDSVRVDALTRWALVSAGEEGLATGHRRAAEALAYAHRVGYLRGELAAVSLVARLAQEEGDYALAFKQYRRGLEIAQTHHLYPRYQFFYDNMGATWLRMGDYRYALKLLTTSAQYLRRYPPAPADSAAVAATLYSHLASTYYQLNRYPDALAAGRRAVATTASAEYRASASRLVADLLDRQGPHMAANDSASQRLKRAVTVHRRANNVFDEAHAALELAGFYLKKGQLGEAAGHAARAEELARRVKAPSLRGEALTILAKVATARGDYRAAVTWKDQLAALNATLFSQEKAQAVATLQAKFEVEQRQYQQQRIESLTRLNKQRAQLTQAQQTKLYLLAAVGSALAFFLAVGIYLYLRLRKANEATSYKAAELEEANYQLTQANQEISAQMHEKEVLVHEIHHRVKNNLQLTDTLLVWQSRALTGPDQALIPLLSNTRARLQSMALVHEFLYRADDLANIRLDTYLDELVHKLHESLSIPERAITLSTDLAPHLMEAKAAGALGLMVNELVTNAYKHAFAERETGSLHVSLSTKGKGFALRVIDDGVGLPAGNFTGRQDSLGMKLITIMAKQLGASLSAESYQPSGTCVLVTTA